jgi:hypothetical protein
VVSFHERLPNGGHPRDFDAPESATRGGGADDPAGRWRSLRLSQGGVAVTFGYARPAVIVVAVALGLACACSGERYSRPDGPVPRYEPAPVLAFDAGVPADGSDTGNSQGSGETASRFARLPARSAINDQGDRTRDERHHNTNVSDD